MASTRLLLRSKPHKQPALGHWPAADPVNVAGGNLWMASPRLAAERRPAVMAAKASPAVAPEGVVTTDPSWNQALDSASNLVASAAAKGLAFLRTTTKRRPRKMNVQMLVERGIIDCRFFTWLAVAGTLLGSILCFLEGCFIVLESYVQYFRSVSLISDQAVVIQLLIEALDMFLIGTAMLIFGVSLHVMFVGSKGEPGPDKARLHRSSLFGLYSLSGLPSWVEVQSVSKAKSKIGHAAMMLLQVGLLEKFKSIPITTGLDLACFAGAVLLSSACTFFLSKLSSD